MRRYIYISTSANLTQEEVDNILSVSKRNNAANNLTGFLLYNGRNFLQAIEGETASLIALMSRLANDPRHSGIVRIQDEEITERSCPDWEMTEIRLSNDVAQRKAELQKQLPAALDDRARQMVMNFAMLN